MKPLSALTRPFAAAALALLATGCMSGAEALVADVSPEGWSEEIRWDYPNTDTLTPKDISFTLRHSAGITPAESVYVIEALSPSGERFETSVRIVADPAAQQASRLKESGAIFRTAVRLSEAGDYRFVVTPLQPVGGVWSVAIELDKSSGSPAGGDPRNAAIVN